MIFRTLLDTAAGYLQYGAYTARAWLSGLRAPLPAGASGEPPHLLLLAWTFPPELSGGVYRPLALVRTASAKGWKVTVVCGPEPDEPTEAGAYLRTQVPDDVTVLRTPLTTRKPSHNWFPRIDGGILNALGMVRAALKSTHGPSVVLASGPPFNSFVAGWYLSRILRAPLALDYRDEWTQCPFEFVRLGNRDMQWEQRCLQAADRIIVTTESFASQLQQAFELPPTDKLKVIPNGYEPEDFDSATRAAPKTRSGPFTFAYFGYLAEHVHPESFAETLRKALQDAPELNDKVRFRFVGKRTSSAEAALALPELRNMVEFGGHLPKLEAARQMAQSDALLLFNPSRLHRYIPGKLFDYVASGPPVLVIGSGGEIEKAINASKTGRVVPGDSPAALIQAINDIADGRYDAEDDTRRQWLSLHERGRVSERLLESLAPLALTAPSAHAPSY